MRTSFETVATDGRRRTPQLNQFSLNNPSVHILLISSETMAGVPRADFAVLQVCTIGEDNAVALSSAQSVSEFFSHSLQNDALIHDDAESINISAIGDRGCGKSLGLTVIAFLLGLCCRFHSASSTKHTTTGVWASRACWTDRFSDEGQLKAIRLWDLQGMNVRNKAVETALGQLACPVSDVVLYFMLGTGHSQLQRLSLTMSTMESMVNSGLRRSMPRVVLMIRDRAMHETYPDRLDGGIPGVNLNEFNEDEDLSPLSRLCQHLSSFTIPEVNLDGIEKKINWTSPRTDSQLLELHKYFAVYSNLVMFLKSPVQQCHYMNMRSSDSLMLLRETVSWIQQNGIGTDVPWPSIHQVLIQHRGNPERLRYTNMLVARLGDLIAGAASCFGSLLLSGADEALIDVITDYRDNSALKHEFNFDRYLVEPSRSAWEALVTSFKRVILSARQHHSARLLAAKEATKAAITALSASILETASGAEVNQTFSSVPNLIRTFDDSVSTLSAPAYENDPTISVLFVDDWIGALDTEKVQTARASILVDAEAQWSMIHHRNCSLHLTQRELKRATAAQAISHTVDVRPVVGSSYTNNQTQTRLVNIGTLLPQVLGTDKLPHLLSLEVQAHYILENSRSTPLQPCGTMTGVTSLVNLPDGGKSWFLSNITYNAATTTVSATLGSGGWGKCQARHHKQLQSVTIRATPNELFSNPRAAEDYIMGDKPF